MKKLLFLLALPVFAQNYLPPEGSPLNPVIVSVNPSGTCTQPSYTSLNYGTGVLTYCQYVPSTGRGTYTQIAAGGGGNATTINGAAVPASQTCLGSNSSSQLITGTCGGGGGTPGGASGDVQVNASGSFAGRTPGPGIDLSTSNFINTGGGQSTVPGGLKMNGDSITAAVGATSTPNGYAALLNVDINSGPFVNAAVAGDRSSDMIFRILTADTPGDSGNPVRTTMIGTNDQSAGLLAINQTWYSVFQTASSAWLSLSSTNKVFATSALFSQGGTWTSDTTFTANPGLMTTVAASTLTDSAAYVGPNGIMYLWYRVDASNAGTFTVSVDGVAQTDTLTASSTLSSQFGANAPINVGTTTGAVARFTGLTPGIHTVLITATPGAGSVSIIAIGFPPAVRYRGATAPAVAQGGVPYNQNNSQPNFATVDGWSQAVAKQLLADGLNVKFVNVRANLDPIVDMSGTAIQNCPASTNIGLHPNNCGHMHLKQAFEYALGSVVGVSPSVLSTKLQINYAASSLGDLNNTNSNTVGTAVPYGIDLYANLATGQVNGIFVGSGIKAFNPTGMGTYGAALFNGTAGFLWCLNAEYTVSAGSFPSGGSALTCRVEVGAGLINNATGLATSGTNTASSSHTFYNSIWNGSVGGYENYSNATEVSASGINPDTWFRVKSQNPIGTGKHGFAVENSSSHYMKFFPINASFDSIDQNTNLTATRTYEKPDASGTYALALTGTSASLGGGALLAGVCSTVAVSITGVTSAMSAVVSPVADPGDAFYWHGVPSAGSVLVKVCAAIAGTPTATTYNVRVIQ